MRKRIAAKSIPCPSCGKEKIIEIFENDNIKEKDVSCSCGKDYIIKYSLVNGKINTHTKLKLSNIKRKTICNHPMMGLNDTICENPIAYCSLHAVMLSKEDIERKKCNAKLSFDMIGVSRCNVLKYLQK